MLDKNPSCISRVENLIGFILYTFDILQDVWAIQRSLSSQKDYPIVSTQRIFERQFGYFMICIFIISVMVVGLDAIMKGSQLILVKKHKWLIALMAIACFMNLGPVLFIFLGFLLEKECFKRFYVREKDIQRDRHLVKQALSSTITKAAVCENGPMLVVMCLKMAISTNLVPLDLISSLSSACLFAKTILTFVNDNRASSPGFLKTLTRSLFMGVFMFLTIFTISSFAIESERAGILIPLDAEREDSAGLVFLLLIFPTLFFSLIPFSIYDLIPFMFGKSFFIWEHFQRPPKKIWYSSILLCSWAFSFNLATSWYLLRRDPISFVADVKLSFDAEGCSKTILPAVSCYQYEFHMGAGRIYFKAIPILTIVTSMVAFVISTFYILGMRHRDRQEFRDRLEVISVQELSDTLLQLKRENLLQDLFEDCCTHLTDESSVIDKMDREEDGKNTNLRACF